MSKALIPENGESPPLLSKDDSKDSVENEDKVEDTNSKLLACLRLVQRFCFMVMIVVVEMLSWISRTRERRRMMMRQCGLMMAVKMIMDGVATGC